MITRIEVHDGFYGGGNWLSFEVNLDKFFAENPAAAASREEIENKLLITTRVQLGDDVWLVRDSLEKEEAFFASQVG